MSRVKAGALTPMLITGSPEIARYAFDAGVSRIFVDMEVRGKAERQGHLDTHRASHTMEDLERVRAAAGDAEIMVRVNPLYEGTGAEVNAALARGADRLMLPMFRTRAEVETYLGAVGGRVPVTLLAETPEAAGGASNYIDLLSGRDELYVGLNDLSLALGANFLFEPLAGGLLEEPAALAKSQNIGFGFGGIARMGERRAPLPAELILSEHVRLGSTAVILSRAFVAGAQSLRELRDKVDLEAEVVRLREEETRLRGLDAAELEANREALRQRVADIARDKAAALV